MNIAEILKNAPKGLKLYSPLVGEVKFWFVGGSDIISIHANDRIYHFYYDGKYFDYKDAECLLFPDKSKSWNNWKDKLLYKKGTVISDKDDQLYIVSFYDSDSIYCKNVKGESIYFRKNKQFTWANESQIKLFHKLLENRGLMWNGSTIVSKETLETLIEKLDKKCPNWRKCIYD